ncbi:hypothetical protein FRC09_001392 [Ceratobasidium sp. 395]|nr:hypothetical protein FRC09_001392 [Ceratobasidium sp. 395]
MAVPNDPAPQAEQQHLVNQVKNMTLEKEEEECYLIWNCDYLCAHALGSTSGEASLKVPKCGEAGLQ